MILKAANKMHELGLCDVMSYVYKGQAKYPQFIREEKFNRQDSEGDYQIFVWHHDTVSSETCSPLGNSIVYE